MKTIKITCDTCRKAHEVKRTNEIPDHVVSMGCNWCPECEDRAKDYYEEWYNDNDGDNEKTDNVPDNQLVIPFIIEDIIRDLELQKQIVSHELRNRHTKGRVEALERSP